MQSLDGTADTTDGFRVDWDDRCLPTPPSRTPPCRKVNAASEVAAEHTVRVRELLDAAPRTGPRAMTQRHNCLLIDGEGQTPAGDGGNVTDFFASDICDFVTADATTCYEGTQRVARTLFMIKPGYLLMHDEVTTTDDRSLAARFHPGEGVEVAEEGGRLVLAGKTGVLNLHVIHPEGFSIKRGEHNANTRFLDIALPPAATHNLLTLMHSHRADVVSPPAPPAAEIRQDAKKFQITLSGDAYEDVITIGRDDGTWRWVSTPLGGGSLRAFCREAQL